LVEDFEIHVYIDLQSYYKINTNKDETQISNKSLYFFSIKKKKKKKKYHTVGTISKSIIKIVERGKIDTPSTKMSIFNDDRKLFNTMSKTAN
jgi:hypothetical protein